MKQPLVKFTLISRLRVIILNVNSLLRAEKQSKLIWITDLRVVKQFSSIMYHAIFYLWTLHISNFLRVYNFLTTPSQETLKVTEYNSLTGLVSPLGTCYENKENELFHLFESEFEIYFMFTYVDQVDFVFFN